MRRQLFFDSIKYNKNINKNMIVSQKYYIVNNNLIIGVKFVYKDIH